MQFHEIVVSQCFTVSIVMTFIFKLTKFRASTLMVMNICPHKEKLKEGQKNGQNGIFKHYSEYVIKWGKSNKKISPKFGQ